MRQPPATSSDANANPADLEVPSSSDLSFFYLVFLGALGTQVTYLPLALHERGLSLIQISAILSLPPLVRVIAPGIWGYVADRFHLTGFLLRVCCWGALLSYIPLLSGSYTLTAICLFIYTFFRTPASVLADTLAFRRVAITGGSYGWLRMWGTVGYVGVTVGCGYLAERAGAAWAVMSGLGLLAVAAAITHRLPRTPRRPAQPLGPALRMLFGRPAFVAFLLATTLHTIGQATYDSFFPIHLERLGVSSHAIGWTIAIGATAEVLVMWMSRRLLDRFGTSRLYAMASGVAALRWLLNAWVVDPGWLIAIQVLHGITFGAWYVAAATYVDQHAPPEVRASAQGLLAIFSFGLGGMLAMFFSGWIGTAYGTAALFELCAVCAFIASLLAAKAMGTVPPVAWPEGE